jgi:septation ring formation regulator EzrA
VDLLSLRQQGVEVLAACEQRKAHLTETARSQQAQLQAELSKHLQAAHATVDRSAEAAASALQGVGSLLHQYTAIVHGGQEIPAASVWQQLQTRQVEIANSLRSIPPSPGLVPNDTTFLADHIKAHQVLDQVAALGTENASLAR